MLTYSQRQALRNRLALGHVQMRAAILPFLLCAGTGLLIWLWTVQMGGAHVWNGFDAAMGNAFGFCEANHMDSVIRQPSNTWSNMGYLFVGVFILALAIHDLRLPNRLEADNFMVRHPIFSVLFAVSCLILFFGSFFYHASLTAFFQRIDQAAMYSLVLLVISVNVYRLFPRWRLLKRWRSSHLLFVLAFTLALWGVFSHISVLNINSTFPALVAISLVSSLVYLRYAGRGLHFLKYFKVAYGTLFMGGAIWALDRSHTLCNPESLLQGHALWHLLTAASALLLYMFYRSEANRVAN